MEQVPESSSGPLKSNRPIDGVEALGLNSSWQLEPRAAIFLGSNRHCHPSDWLNEVGAACEAAVFSPQAYPHQMQILSCYKLQVGQKALLLSRYFLSMCP